MPNHHANNALAQWYLASISRNSGIKIGKTDKTDKTDILVVNWEARKAVVLNDSSNMCGGYESSKIKCR